MSEKKFSGCGCGSVETEQIKEVKVTSGCGCGSVQPEEVKQSNSDIKKPTGIIMKKQTENWYLPYMDKKTKAMEVEADRHIIVSKDLGVAKNFDLNSATDLEKISNAVENAVLEVYEK